MSSCRHPETEFVGEQTTEGGVNVFRRCLSCGVVLVVTPSQRVMAVKARDEHDN